MSSASPSESAPLQATDVSNAVVGSGWSPSEATCGEFSAFRLGARGGSRRCGRGLGVRKMPVPSEVSPSGSTSGFGFDSRIPSRAANGLA